MHVEDHPLDYGGFEGTIPKGEYGGGTVMLWDEGTWEPEGDPHQMLEKGDLKFTLHGKRLKGSWVLVHMKGRDAKTRNGPRENWLLIKHRDEHATDKDTLTEEFTTSVETGRDLARHRRGQEVATQIRAARRAGAGLDKTRAKQKLPAFQAAAARDARRHVPRGEDWLFEMKYDGYRALAAVAADQVRIYTRNENDWTNNSRRW